VVAADNALAKARSDLKLLRDGATPEALRNAELDIEKAKNSLWSRQISRDAVCGRGPSTGCDAANADVAATETALTQARVNYDRVKAGPKPEEIANAERTVETAQASLGSARAKLDLVSSGAKPVDITTAEKNIASAKAALEAAQVSYDQAVAMSAKGGDYEVQIQQKNVELSRVALQVYEEQMELALIKAPFDGAVISTAGREGDEVKAYTAMVTIANPKTIQVALELQPTDLAKVQSGQEAVIVFSSFPTEKIDSKVVFIPSLSAGSDPQLPATQRTVRLDFASPRPLELGALANITISTQKKDDVLILPNTAIRIFGGRRFVRLATTSGRKQEVDIEVGINNETETEIVKGLREGQKVVGQ
jgi:RND family efflux transporter MFP subunit